jgi:hypothetical protein
MYLRSHTEEKLGVPWARYFAPPPSGACPCRKLKREHTGHTTHPRPVGGQDR